MICPKMNDKAEIINFTDIQEFDYRMDEKFRRLVEAYSDAKRLAKEAEQLLEVAKKELLASCEGRNTKGCGVTVSKVTRAGSVDLERIPELQGVDLNAYRKPGTSYWTIN